jgi:hypothetical protein
VPAVLSAIGLMKNADRRSLTTGEIQSAATGAVYAVDTIGEEKSFE